MYPEKKDVITSKNQHAVTPYTDSWTWAAPCEHGNVTSDSRRDGRFLRHPNKRVAEPRSEEVSKLVLLRLLGTERQGITILRNNGKKRRELPTQRHGVKSLKKNLHQHRCLFVLAVAHCLWCAVRTVTGFTQQWACHNHPTYRQQAVWSYFLVRNCR